jgi:ubiquinone/menaquinone biosynthesis C-methylase UbiE
MSWSRPSDAWATDLLSRCGRGELSPAIVLVRLLIAYPDVGTLRSTIGPLAQGNREPGIRKAADRIQELLTTNPKGIETVLSMLQQERAAAEADEADQVERCQRLFERLVSENAAASVALYSLGVPELLHAATCEIVKLLERLQLLGPERRVLEIGCGIGRFQEALAQRVAAIIGIDIAPGMIEAARERCAGLPNVTLLETSGRDLSSFPAASFDLVLAIDAMPYVYRAGAALVAAHFAEAARVLRAGGDFLILNLSYRGDLDLDRHDAGLLAEATGLRVLRDGSPDLRLWDAATFHLRKPPLGAVRATLKENGAACARSMAARGLPRRT